ncbi:MAG TPA: nucleoside monophosphate kinase [Patescibacteria group bacterium]|nr:nucleoside monophosphate kinase [Patescibacteria group bacterium]
MKILMMGPQGSGKGTTGEMLSVHMRIPLISIGNLLREMSSEHPRYEEVQRIMREGNLVPQDFISQLLNERVSRSDCTNGFIMDGWGRTMYDLQMFDPGFDKVLYLNISPETSVRRISNRRICSKCGRVYNIITVPPKESGICDICGGELIQREDDTEGAVRKRLDIYYTETQEVINFFKDKGVLLEIDAEGSPKLVFENVLAALALK